MATPTSELKVQSEALIFSNLSSYQTDATQKDFLLPFKDLQTRASTGDCSAQVLVGLSFVHGWYDCFINEQEGHKWLELAKKQEKSSPAKICAEGFYYERGIGGVLIKNPDKAKDCYASAIKQGYVPALYCLAGILYLEERDNKTTQESYVAEYTATTEIEHVNLEKRELIRQLSTQCAEQGFAPGLSELALCYYRGWGVKKDYAEALRLAKMAAQQGVANAKNTVGALYHNGEGVTTDHSEARKWYKMASDQGLAMAKRNLEKTECCTIL